MACGCPLGLSSGCLRDAPRIALGLPLSAPSHERVPLGSKVLIAAAEAVVAVRTALERNREYTVAAEAAGAQKQTAENAPGVVVEPVADHSRET